jgi:excisionase family DNA binding protein
LGPAVFEPLLGVADVARLLSCSTHSVYRLASRGQINGVRVGSAIRFTHASVRAFIAKGGAR